MALTLTNLTTAEIERYVGQRIRERRTMLGLTQQQLAEKLGITYQQAHKYERGINRVSAGRLYELASVLNVDVGFFFEGLSAESATDDLNPRQRMCLDVARNFTRIADLRQQDALAQLTRTLAERSGARRRGGKTSEADTPEDDQSES